MKSMVRLFLLVLLAGPFTASLAAAGPFCTDTRSAEDAPIREGDFDLYRAQRNLEWLDSLAGPFDQAIAKASANQPADPGVLPSETTFATSYPNALRQIQGALLKQRAEFAEQELQLAKARRHPKEARTAAADFQAARREFCDYLATSRYAE
jgi:hypothetical protein